MSYEPTYQVRYRHGNETDTRPCLYAHTILTTQDITLGAQGTERDIILVLHNIHTPFIAGEEREGC